MTIPRLKPFLFGSTICLLAFLVVVPNIFGNIDNALENKVNSNPIQKELQIPKTPLIAENPVRQVPFPSNKRKKNIARIPNLPDTEEAARAAQAALHTKFPDRTMNIPLPLAHQEQQTQPFQNQEQLMQQSGAITVDENTGLPLPFPVYTEPDDKIPGPSGHNSAASEVLECRDNVIEFVIHASDVKDECEGLQRAFDAHCAIATGIDSPNNRRRLSNFSFSQLRKSAVKTKEMMTNSLMSAWDGFILNDQHRRLEAQDVRQEQQLQQPLSQPSPLQQPVIENSLSLLSSSAHNIEKQQNSPDMAHRVKQSPAVKSATQNFFQSLEAEELKTCCSSIMNVFHEHCDHKVEDELNDSRLFVIVAVIAICLLVKSLIKTFQIRWLPEAAGCILVGVFGGVILEFIPHMDFSFDEKFFLRVMLPPIVFEAALNIDKKAFFRHAVPITLYAVFGTILSSVLTAFVVYYASSSLSDYYCTTIPFIDSLTFGALISSIDPIAVLSVLTNMGMSSTDTIYVMVFGESLLNDGVAIVLFETLIRFLNDNMVIDAHAIMEATQHFVVVAIGSVVVGIVSGAFCTGYFWAMRGCHSPLAEVLTFFCWALLPFYVCDGVGWSGIVGLVAAGFIMDVFVVGKHDKKNHSVLVELDEMQRIEISTEDRPIHLTWAMLFKQKGQLSDTAKRHVGFVTEINATLMETAIFAYLGLFLCSYRYHWNFFLSTIAIVACVLSRAIMIPFLSAVSNFWMKSRMSKQAYSNRHDNDDSSTGSDDGRNYKLLTIDRPLQLVMLFSGLRGAMSFALVENIPLYDAVTGHGSRLKPELKSMTSACIAFTVFILGGSTFYLLEYLGFAMKKDDEMIELTASLVGGKVDIKSNDDQYDDSDEDPFVVHKQEETSQNRLVRQRIAGKDGY